MDEKAGDRGDLHSFHPFRTFLDKKSMGGSWSNFVANHSTTHEMGLLKKRNTEYNCSGIILIGGGNQNASSSRSWNSN